MGVMDGKVSIITGAGTGIGKVAAIMFAEAGSHLVLAGRRQAPLDEVAELAREHGVEVEVRPTDLEDGDAAADLGKWSLERPYSAAKAASLNMIRGMNTELAKHGVRACAIMPGEVDTPILENRPRPPDADDRSTMMQAEDIAQAIFLCAAMPQRTIVEQVVMMPTMRRDTSRDMAAAESEGSNR